MSNWSPESWQRFPAHQQPEWPDQGAVDEVLKEISTLPPLVFAGEARTLRERLADVCEGNALLLQAGDCAESFDDLSADAIRDKLKVILQMAVALTYSTGMPVVKVGRIAGQFAKPRSSPTETKDDVELPSFRGHIVNAPDFSEGSRVADPRRLLQAYNQSASTLNLLRAFTRGGFANLENVSMRGTRSSWPTAPPASGTGASPTASPTRLAFMRAVGIDPEDAATLHEVEFFTSHEALLLGYEQALTRQDSLTDQWYDCSAHMLWIGERTRQLDGAHLEFLRGVHNPLGCKVGPTATPDEALGDLRALNPDAIPGRLTLITRFGADKIAGGLPPLLEAVDPAGHPVVWACDPMHGNTFTAPSGRKTRHLDDVIRELNGVLRRPRCRGNLGGWHPRRADGRRRHRVSRRCR